MTGYCPRCGVALTSAPPTACTACGYQLFVNARPTGGVIIVRDGHVLALRRVSEPGAGHWDIPSGFCEGWEHPAEAAVREAHEELGLTVALGDFIGMYVGSYEFQGEQIPVLDCFWFATVLSGELTLDPAEASGSGWLPLSDPPRMAFDTMDRALRDVARSLAVKPAPKPR